MKRLLSYVYPISRTVTSVYNGELEITWYNGKKHLNSKNANYSYGSLQRILKFGIDQIDLSKVSSILVLGMGGGSVIETLRNDFKYSNVITAVEIDPVIIDIAKHEFDITENENLKIHCGDAFAFIKANKRLYDLIIVDLFIDINVPNQFLSMEFWKAVINSKSSKGAIIFNAAVGKTESKDKLDSIISLLQSKIFKISVHEKVHHTNTVIIASGL
jgi:spermidine synthase